ncbi:hypothetical protein [Ferrimonas balearica]|uniref:hypothetical protein n=1 Tax=Ferrimonas balearica TaxID=44012 RepID=UPI001C99F674|nr:hypothetical protein [Ferrimonas balearica]MBY5920419.1 hypothetical protein [Ferrimonas balearica]MBY5996896.1 hypothetical protein [Ferrimonas balearica]
MINIKGIIDRIVAAIQSVAAAVNGTTMAIGDIPPPGPISNSITSSVFQLQPGTKTNIAGTRSNRTSIAFVCSADCVVGNMGMIQAASFPLKAGQVMTMATTAAIYVIAPEGGTLHKLEEFI